MYAAPWVPAAVRASIVSMFGTLGRPQPEIKNNQLDSGVGVVPGECHSQCAPAFERDLGEAEEHMKVS